MEVNKVYHVMTKSIAEYIIFNNEMEYVRMKQLIQYYQVENPSMRFSYFVSWKKDKNEAIQAFLKEYNRYLDGMIATERKRADEEVELRKREFEG